MADWGEKPYAAIEPGRPLSRLVCIPLFAAAMATWTDIGGINELATAAHRALQNFAQH